MSAQDGQASQRTEPTQPGSGSAPKRHPVVTTLVALGIVGLLYLVINFVSYLWVPDVPGVTLTDMHSIEDLRTRFNQDYGKPRLILLLSPT